MSARATWPCALALAAALTACGGGGALRGARFSSDWSDDGGASIGRAWGVLQAATIAPSADVAVGIAGNTDKLVGLPLGGGPKWTFAHPLDARPVVTGGVVVGSGGGEAFVLDARTGRPLWRRATGGLPMLGAGDDGTVTVLTFRRGGGAGSTLLAMDRQGQVVQQIETDKPLGAPAVIGRFAFVPWASQYVSVIDLSSGEETARVTLREQISRAWTEGGSLWFGQASFIRFDEHIEAASRGQATRAGLPPRDLPGAPRLMASGGEPVASVAGAGDKVRLYARPEAGSGGASLSDGRWYATYFRLAMGFTSDGGKIAWVHAHGSDFLGGSAGPGGVALCDAQGKVTMLDAASGGVSAELDLGEPLRACVVHVDGQRLGGGKAGASLAQQLAAAVSLDDSELAAAQQVLLKELVSIDDEVATQTLVDLASDPKTSPALLPDARAALAHRHNGATAMIRALDRHYDFLRDVLRTAPVGPLAQALGALKDTRAAGPLAAHLLDPSDTDEDVRHAAAALAVVAGPEQLPALRQFFGMYRARAATDDLAAAVASAGEALVRLGDVAVVTAAAKDEGTVPYARQQLQALLAAMPATAPTGADAGAKKTK